MDDSAWLIALLAAGLVAGMLVRRWWVLAVVAVGWLVLGAVALADPPEPTEPSNEFFLLLLGGLLIAAILLAALGIAAGRAVASLRANRPRSDGRRHRSRTARR
jgi:hypothetical protein